MYYTIRRDEYGHAVAIERNGYTALHLNPGTERNEQEVEGVVKVLNAPSDDRLRAALEVFADRGKWTEVQHIQSLNEYVVWTGEGNEPWLIAQEAISTTTESTGEDRVREIECPCCGCQISIEPNKSASTEA